MKVFIPMPDECTDVEALRQLVLVPYRCGMPLLPARGESDADAATTALANPPAPEGKTDLSAAA